MNAGIYVRALITPAPSVTGFLSGLLNLYFFMLVIDCGHINEKTRICEYFEGV